MSGDRNPLHSDPEFARLAGFETPILHGLCTYGFTGRLLLHVLCGSDPARFVSMNGRFSKPVWPGDTLTVSAWVVGAGTALFRTETQSGDVVIDHGRLGYLETAPATHGSIFFFFFSGRSMMQGDTVAGSGRRERIEDEVG